MLQWTGRTMPSGGQRGTFGWTRQGEHFLAFNKQTLYCEIERLKPVKFIIEEYLLL